MFCRRVMPGIRISTFFILASAVALALAAGRNYKKCPSNTDPSYIACLEEAANIYFAHVDEDVGGVHNTFKPINFSIANGPMNINVAFNVTQFVNTTKSGKVTVKYDPASKEVQGTISVPHVAFNLYFDLNGKFRELPLLGKGVAMFHVWDMVSSFKTKVNLKTLEIEGLTFKIDSIKTVKIDVISIDAGDKDLEKKIKEGVVKSVSEIYESAKVVWDDILKLHYEDLTREFLKEIVEDGVIQNN